MFLPFFDAKSTSPGIIGTYYVQLALHQCGCTILTSDHSDEIHVDETPFYALILHREYVSLKYYSTVLFFALFFLTVPAPSFNHENISNI